MGAAARCRLFSPSGPALRSGPICARRTAEAAVPTLKPKFLAEGAGAVVEHREGQKENQEEDGRGYDELQEFLAGVFQVHEEQGNEQGLGGGDE